MVYISVSFVWLVIIYYMVCFSKTGFSSSVYCCTSPANCTKGFLWELIRGAARFFLHFGPSIFTATVLKEYVPWKWGLLYHFELQKTVCQKYYVNENRLNSRNFLITYWIIFTGCARLNTWLWNVSITICIPFNSTSSGNNSIWGTKGKVINA